MSVFLEKLSQCVFWCLDPLRLWCFNVCKLNLLSLCNIRPWLHLLFLYRLSPDIKSWWKAKLSWRSLRKKYRQSEREWRGPYRSRPTERKSWNGSKWRMRGKSEILSFHYQVEIIIGNDTDTHREKPKPTWVSQRDAQINVSHGQVSIFVCLCCIAA